MKANDELLLHLYVVGMSPSSSLAITRLRDLCENVLRRAGRAWRIEIIDVIDNPQAAEDARIVATPTLIRRQPLPEQRIVGDLTRMDTVLGVLGIGADVARSHPVDEGDTHDDT